MPGHRDLFRRSIAFTTEHSGPIRYTYPDGCQVVVEHPLSSEADAAKIHETVHKYAKD